MTRFSLIFFWQIPGILAALDATKESAIAGKFNVKGYPTVKYFVNGEFKFDVNLREAEAIVNFMKDPKEPPPPPPPEKAWADEETNVVHLNDETFKPFLKKKKHVLAMFYAPCTKSVSYVKKRFFFLKLTSTHRVWTLQVSQTRIQCCR